MASQVDIYNMALSNIGISETVQSLEERSKARLTCSRWWDLARDTALADSPWPFATKYSTLALTGTAPKGWLFQYQYPSDCLRAMYLATDMAVNAMAGGIDYGNSTSRGFGGGLIPLGLQPKYITASGPAGQVILTNEPEATLVYIARVADEGLLPPLFVHALSWKLAAMIAMPMTAQRTIAEQAAQGYMQASQIALASALNESTQDVLTVFPEYISSREG